MKPEARKKSPTIYYATGNKVHKRTGSLLKGDQSTFLTGLSGETEVDIVKSYKVVRNMDRINRLHNELNSLMDKYGSSLIHKVEKEDEDYLLAYRAEMLKIQKKLECVRENSESLRCALQGEKYVVALEKSLAWFKEEAQRLAVSTKEQKEEMQYWNDKIALLKQDLNELNQDMKSEGEQLKELEIATGGDSQALAPLSGPDRPQTTKHPNHSVTSVPFVKPGTSFTKFRKGVSRPRICHIIDYMLKEKVGKDKVTEEVVKYYQDLTRKNTEIVKNLENKIDKESNMNLMVNQKQLGAGGRNPELLDVFLRSVERMKTLIAKRNTAYTRMFKPTVRRRRAFSAANGSRRTKGMNTSSSQLNEIKFGKFTATDKKSVFIEFLNYPQVYDKIRSLIEAELSKEKEQEPKEDLEPIEKLQMSGLEGVRPLIHHPYQTTTGAGFELTDMGKQFRASHLYSIPRMPAGFAPDYSSQKRHRKLSASFSQNSRPQTVGDRKLPYQQKRP